MILRRTALAVAVLLVFGVGCKGPSTGGVTIPESDTSAPTVSLQAGATAPGGTSAAVNSGGAAQSMALQTKTGSLNLVASASDPQSGIQLLEIWQSSKVTVCTGDICQTSQPLLGAPRFKSDSPQKKPGEQTSESSILADALELAKELPQAAPAGGAITVEWTLWAKARNHLGGTTSTPMLTVTYHETA